MNTMDADYEVFRLDSCNKFREIQIMPYGKERREQLLDWIQAQTEQTYWHLLGRKMAT